MGLIRALLGAAVLLGPLAWLHRTSRLPAGWHPLLVLSSWTVVVLLSGLVGDLRVGVALVVLAGLALLVRELLLDRANVVATVREPSALALGATTLVLIAVLHGQVFTHYDNFSHWALVLEVMLADHALPTPQDPVVAFTTYPLGGASLAYLFSTVLGRAEWVAMLGQSLFIVSCALPLVTTAGRRWAVGLAVYLVGALALLSHVTSPSSLLVDGLVGGLGGALLVLLLLHRATVLAHPWAPALVAAALVTVKSSGLFFVAVATVLWLALLLRSRREEPLPDAARPRRPGVWRHAGSAAALALPWLVWWAWGRHVATTFPQAGESKHSVSVDRFGSVLGEKTAEDVRTILRELLGATLLDGRLWLLLVGLLLAGAMAVRVRALTARSQRRLLVVVLVTVLLWELSLAVMYLLSMPLGEALMLAGFRRYQGTIHLTVVLVALSALALWGGAVEARALTRPRAVTSVLTAGVVVVSALALVEPSNLDRPDENSPRHSVEQALAGVQVSDDDQVCVLLQSPDGGYRTWITRYVLRHEQVRSDVIPEDAAALPGRLDPCDLFVLLDPRPHTADLLGQAGHEDPPDQEVPMVIQR